MINWLLKKFQIGTATDSVKLYIPKSLPKGYGDAGVVMLNVVIPASWQGKRAILTVLPADGEGK
jgi:hypothetical protein